MSGRSKNPYGGKRDRMGASSLPNMGDNDRQELPIGKIFMAVLALAALLVGVYIQLARNMSEIFTLGPPSSSTVDSSTSSPAVSLYKTIVLADNIGAGYLDHIIATLVKYDHQLTFSSLSAYKSSSANLAAFDLIWSHDYPFTNIKKLQPRQRVNHFPGTGFITNKLTLSTTPNLPHQLRAFRLPVEKDKFLHYVDDTGKGRRDKNDQPALWVRKGSGHRGISIESVESIIESLDVNKESGLSEDILVQEFMSNPLLIDGKKFDIGIYAVLTSVDPLRVYIYESEALIRFCSQPYLDPATRKFNSSNLDSYVVGDDYTPIWMMPSMLRYYIGTNLSMKQSLNTYLSQLGLSGNSIWKQIEETIMAVYKAKELHLSRMSRAYQQSSGYNATSFMGSLNQFFEMVRFDFIIDDALQVYLMEANMSPNLSSRHFPPNRLIYEQVLASYLSLVGLDTFSHRQMIRSDLAVLPTAGDSPGAQPSDLSAELIADRDHAVGESSALGLDDLINEKELSVYEELCASDECHMNCAKPDCKVCYFCLNYSDKLHLRRAIYEQMRRWNFKRLLPSTHDEHLKLQQSSAMTSGDSDSTNTDRNYIHVQWFRGKCHTDQRFCSYD